MDGIVVRRVIPSDGSCLFNSVGYVMDHDKNKASTLRQVVAATVLSDPEKYSEAFLGMPNEEYAFWILESQSWGGAIELSILADHYNCEIASYHIQTARCDLYGQGHNYSQRAMLIYDGSHYDALVLSPFDHAPEELDATKFDVQLERTIGPVEGLALNFVKDQQRKVFGFHCTDQVVDRESSSANTANFTLQCVLCQIGLVGEKEASEHAKAIGHVKFKKYER